MKHMGRTIMAALAGAVIAGAAGPAAAQQRPTISLALPGIPPVFIGVQPLVAQQEKLFDKYNVNVTLRPFDTGAAAARAVVAGDLDVSISPTALIINMISNANVDLVTIFGYEKPTWRIASMDPNTRCEDLKGQPVAVDTPGGARSIALNQMLRACNLTANDTQQVGMSSNGSAALIAGQIKHAVQHLDEVPVVERESGKPVKIVVTLADVTPVNHYTTLTTTRAKVESKRDALVRMLAALMEATAFMSDPANADRVAKAAEPTGRKPEDAKRAVAEYVKMDFWTKDGHGLTPKNIEAVTAVQKRVGGITEGKEPVRYERFVNLSIYEEAVKLVRSKKGS
jgi:ABC-type nitrate/sulfonate/bicarbonate transport system substrate-binding protein